jgi:hypothetical protein
VDTTARRHKSVDSRAETILAAKASMTATCGTPAPGRSAYTGFQNAATVPHADTPINTRGKAAYGAAVSHGTGAVIISAQPADVHTTTPADLSA